MLNRRGQPGPGGGVLGAIIVIVIALVMGIFLLLRLLKGIPGVSE